MEDGWKEIGSRWSVGMNVTRNDLSKILAVKGIFKQFHKVSLAKIAYVSDILKAHEVWKILLWR